jgi:hypothetical protein
MAEKPQLKINLADPEDIKAKLPHARTMLDAKRRIVKEAERDFDNWALLVKRLEVLAGVETKGKAKGGAAGQKGAPMQDAVVQVVENEGRPMTPPRVAEILREDGVPVTSTNAINAALYAAEKHGRLVKPRKGLYAPKGYGDPDMEAALDNLLVSEREAQE